MEMIETFGTGTHRYAVYMDPTFRRPFAVGRLNSRGEVVERVANRKTRADATKEARSRAQG